MKKIIVLLLSIMITGAALQAVSVEKNVVPAADAPKINLSRSGGYGPYRSMHPVIKVLDNGDIIVLWEEGVSEKECNIVYRILKKNTGKWVPDLDSLPNVAAQRIYSCTFPQVDQSPDGVVHISFQDGTSQRTRDPWYAKYENGVWTKQRVVYDAPNSAWPRVNVDPATGDIFVTWHYLVPHGDDPTIVEGDSEIQYSVLRKGSTTWTKPKNFSNAYLNHLDSAVRGSITIHHSTAFTKGMLHGIFMDGDEGDWEIAGSAMPSAGYPGYTGQVNPQVIAKSGYWPELEADSDGNLYGIYTFRTGTMGYGYRRHGGNWTHINTIGPGKVDFIGLKVARNNVAYAITMMGYAEGFLPVIVPFTHNNVSKMIQVDDSSRYPIRLEIDVDNNGAMHAVWTDRSGNSSKTDDFATGVWYRKIAQKRSGATLDIEGIPGTILTNEPVELQGKVVNTAAPVAKHTWYIPALGIWESGQNYTANFPTPGMYDIHYYVADNDNMMGHKQVTVEVIDAPFQPVNATVSASLIKGFFLRRYINELQWKGDTRNDNKFDNLTHFNIYRRKAGETSWGSVYEQIDYVSSSASYLFRDDQPGFETEAETAEYEYAVTVVADVDGSEKESKKTVFSR